MQNKLKVSILTPLYNHEVYLQERFRSIQEQTYEDWEWIIVDDCSTDGSFELAIRLAEGDSRIRVLRNLVNSGGMATAQRAFDESVGEIIYSCASDDSVTSNYLEEAVKAFHLNPDVGLFSSGSAYLDHENRTWTGLRKPVSGYFTGAEFLRLMLASGHTLLNAPSRSFRRSVYIKAGGHCPVPGVKLNGFEDGFLYMRLALFGDVLRVSQRLAYYRLHDSNLSKVAFQQPNAERECFIRFKALDLFFEMATEHSIAVSVTKTEAYQAAADFIWRVLVLRLRKANAFEYAAEVEEEIYKYIPGYVPSVCGGMCLFTQALGQFRQWMHDGHRLLTRRPLR